MSAAYRSDGGYERDHAARLDELETRVAELRELFGGVARRSLEDRLTSIERLLVRLEAQVSMPAPATRGEPGAAAPEPAAPNLWGPDLPGMVRRGVRDGLDEVVAEVRGMSANYHRVATDIEAGIRRVTALGDEIVGALERRDHLIQDEVVARLVAALDEVIGLRPRDGRRLSKGLADAAAEGSARGGAWDTTPSGGAARGRITIRREGEATGAGPDA